MGFSKSLSGIVSLLSISSLINTIPVSASAGYTLPAQLLNVNYLLNSVSQQVQSGASTLGTDLAPVYQQFLNTSGTPLPQGFPWGTKTVNNTNPYTNPPNTGVTRSYTFTISNVTLSPDGVPKPMLLVNGQFPGPTIEANWGDEIQVTVTNNLATEGTSLHWHGFLQQGTPYEDGVPGVNQCPIAPGKSFTYKFQATLYGSSWYHSHYSAQYSAGTFGPIIVHGPNDVGYDVDLGPVLLTDWYHGEYFSLVEELMAKNVNETVPPFSDNNLINGKMNYDCSLTTGPCTPNAGISKFYFQTGKTHRLRLINAGTQGTQQFTIDGHTMTVIANDFVPVTPYSPQVITLGVGQRSDILVKATGQANGAYWMRSTIGRDPSCGDNQGVNEAVAAIYYPSANKTAVPTTSSTVTLPTFCSNDALTSTVPLYPIAAQEPTNTTDLTISAQINGSSVTLWYVNNSTFRDDYNDPVLLEAKLGNLTFAPERNVYNFGENKSVRFVVYNTFAFTSHPMHMHGHNFYVLATGYGTWNGVVTNQNNPQRRDTQLLPPAQLDGTPAYIVVQFDLDNPGVWPFHCHIAWHISAGLYINIIERPADINETNIPSVMAQTCRDWSAFTGTHIPDQIDSGL
ncbi:MAG: hypothetical protein Q9165_004012 [Trypethelium subeluteriae]